MARKGYTVMTWWNSFLANTWWGQTSATLAAILRGQKIMDERVQKLQQDFDTYKGAVDAAFAGWMAYKASVDEFKAAVETRIAAAVAADDAEEEVDLKAMSDDIAAAGQNIVTAPEVPVPPPPIEPSNL